MKRYIRPNQEQQVVKHYGIFRYQLTTFQAVALIVSGTIGAGVLGIPYAVAKVGIGLGVVLIIIIGMLMMGMNLLIGEIAVRTSQPLQLAGLASRYLGSFGKWGMTTIVYFTLFGVLTIYIIGEGEALSALLGGSAYRWSVLFFLLGTLLIFTGMRTIKIAEFFLSLAVLLVVLLIAVFSAPHASVGHFRYVNLAQILFPYGVLLFAFHGTTTIPEAYSILSNKKENFRRAIIAAGIITTAVYVVFAVAAVAVTGADTTEIATVGMGRVIGVKMLVLGNIFAALAMGTSFLVAGLGLRDSLQWDYKISNHTAVLLVCGVPFLLFIFGLRGFIQTIDLVGGVLMSLELLLILVIYWRAKQKGDLAVGKYHLHHTALLAALLVLALTVGAVYSVGKMF